MTSPRRRLITALAASAVVLAGAPPPFGPGEARAAGVIIVVDTTDDDLFPVGGGCSIRAAITAANTGAASGNCGSGTSEADAIDFDLAGTAPTIEIGSDLPTITQQLAIDGTTTGSTRVRLHGPGSGTGLTVAGATSVIRDLIIDNFGIGIDVGASNVTVAGNVVGPNSSYGIYSHATSVTIGGANGITLGGPCTGDCNRVSGNTSYGLYLSSSGTVKGNFIGTNAAGTAASPNGTGVVVSSGTWTFGGAFTAAGNVVSGNVGDGFDLHGCGCTFQSNRIGTNVAGTAAIPNGGHGIDWADSTGGMIGGFDDAFANVISGNLGRGIQFDNTDAVGIFGNYIGTTRTKSPLGNGSDGIGANAGGNGVDALLIGDITPGGGNTIAYNAGHGIRIIGLGLTTSARNNEIRGNSIFNNTGDGISLENSANQAIAPPTITALAPVAGTACPSCLIEVYSDNATEGRIFDGSAVADGAGNWSFPGLFAGPNVTAIATSTSGSSSEFSVPFAIPATPFTDIATSPFKAEIEWLYANKITTGCAPTLYCPSGSVTREQMASFLVRMFKLPATVTDFFTDDETSQHEPDINRLRAAEITLGCSATEYCPLGLVLRDQMATFLARAAELTVGAGRDYFGDDDGNSHEPNIDRNAAAGITTGCGSFVYCPAGSVTR
ncbi:MAG TPA: S-layer homology domain-containing protein, partial [Ilumatobacteraceae bacterium]|nr:S-layer homology domain-containing protein [Ilumatobacteraceae bacterium]